MSRQMFVRHLGLFFILLQAGKSFGEETQQCQPGFSTDTYLFKVTRKILERGRVLGKVGFDDCTGRSLRAYSAGDSRFRVAPDGAVSLKRQVQLHHGLKTFTVHAWDFAGNKFSAEVAIWNEKELPSTEVISNDGQQEPQGLPTLALLHTLSRKKRNLNIPPISASENERGSFPKLLEKLN